MNLPHLSPFLLEPRISVLSIAPMAYSRIWEVC